MFLKNKSKTKKTGQILIWQQIPKFKNINYLRFVFLNSLPKILHKQSLNQIRLSLTGHNQIWHHFSIKKYESILMTFKIEILWRKWTQIMEMKQNQTFFHGTHSNLTPYLSLSKIIKIFPWLLKLKFLSFMTKMNSSNGIETKSDIFPWDNSNLTLFFIGHKILKYFNDHYKWHFSVPS